MVVTLFVPNQAPQIVITSRVALPLPTGYARVSDEVAQLLGCARGLVDILDCGPDYVAFSIFDCEGATNRLAMDALAAVSAHPYDVNDENHILQGPVLLVTAH